MEVMSELSGGGSTQRGRAMPPWHWSPPAMRTKLSLCQLGAARSYAKLGDKKAKAKARGHYHSLLATWGSFKGQPASRACKTAWREAKASAACIYFYSS